MKKESVFHISSILLLSQGPHECSLSIKVLDPETIKELVCVFGGMISAHISKEEDQATWIFYNQTVGNCTITGAMKTSLTTVMLQREVFQAKMASFEPETTLPIIENAFFGRP